MKIVKINEVNEFKKNSHIPLAGGFFLTRRCSLNCRHCYIVNDLYNELSFEEWKIIFDKFIEMGMLWALLSGGEPLLRPDFSDIYLYLKKKGVLVSVFTNATLITEEIAKMFKNYPPRGLEITVYGSNKEVYEKITQVPGSFEKFINGLEILDKYNVPYILKTMVMRSNYEDLDNIIKFAENRGCFLDGSLKGFRFDGQLNLRSRKNLNTISQKDEEERNRIIREERLDIDTLVFLDEKYPIRKKELEKFCDKFYFAVNNDLLFNCGAGLQAFHIDSNGDFQLCMMTEFPNYPLVKDEESGSVGVSVGVSGSVSGSGSMSTQTLTQALIKSKDKAEIRKRIDYAWNKFVPIVRNMRVPSNYECNKCRLKNLCGNCAANSYLEDKKLFSKPDYYCKIAHKKAKMLGLKEGN